MAELIAALSLGIDLGFGQPMEHVLRQSLIALRLAERVGLDEDERAVVYYTALLISVGCHSDAHEQAKWFGDDIALKSAKFDHEPRSLRMVTSSMRNLGAGRPPLHRFRLGLEFALSGHRDVDGMIEAPCRHRAVAGRAARAPAGGGRGARRRLRDVGRQGLARRARRRRGPDRVPPGACWRSTPRWRTGWVGSTRPGSWPASAAADSSTPCWPTSCAPTPRWCSPASTPSAPGTP